MQKSNVKWTTKALKVFLQITEKSEANPHYGNFPHRILGRFTVPHCLLYETLNDLQTAKH